MGALSRERYIVGRAGREMSGPDKARPEEENKLLAKGSNLPRTEVSHHFRIYFVLFKSYDKMICEDDPDELTIELCG